MECFLVLTFCMSRDSNRGSQLAKIKRRFRAQQCERRSLLAEHYWQKHYIIVILLLLLFSYFNSRMSKNEVNLPPCSVRCSYWSCLWVCLSVNAWHPNNYRRWSGCSKHGVIATCKLSQQEVIPLNFFTATESHRLSVVFFWFTYYILILPLILVLRERKLNCFSFC